MRRREISRGTKALGIMGLVLVTSFCTSQEKQAMTRSSELVAALKKKSIPGLPATLTQEQATEIDHARAGPGAWFVETGCFGCHSVSVYGVKSYSQIGPDLSTAADDVKSRFGKTLDEFWKAPVGTMMMVRSDLIKLTPEEQAIALDKLKAAHAEHERQKAAPRSDEKR